MTFWKSLQDIPWPDEPMDPKRLAENRAITKGRWEGKKVIRLLLMGQEED